MFSSYWDIQKLHSYDKLFPINYVDLISFPAIRSYCVTTEYFVDGILNIIMCLPGFVINNISWWNNSIVSFS